MNNWRSHTTILLLVFSMGLGAQDGSIDPTFNAGDPGFGQGDGVPWNTVNACLVQPDGKIVFGGDFFSYNSTSRRGINRVNSDGTLDASFLAGTGAIGTVHALAYQADGKILIGGAFGSFNGTVRNRLARLNANGSLDMGFETTIGPSSTVYSIAIQPDGKILIGGYFSTYNGEQRNKIARLNADGSLDMSFDPGTGALGGGGSLGVLSIAIQTDEKILIGGEFSTYNGTARNGIARLNANGTLDTSFNPGTGTSSPIRCISLQSDGKIIIGGDFTLFNNVGRSSIARLNANGGVDTSFDPGIGVNAGGTGAVHSITMRPNGTIVIAGWIGTYNGTVRNRIASLFADGSLDTNFDPGAGANQTIRCTALQADGKMVIGGDFIFYRDRGCGRMTRINADGTADTGFNLGAGANNQVHTTAIQPDGKIVIGGSFTSYAGLKCDQLVRLLPNGDQDPSFNLGNTNGQYIYHALIQPDGKIILSGLSDSFNGFIRRCNTDGSLDPGFVSGGFGGTNSRVLNAALQPDGKLIVVGSFTSYGGSSSNDVVRLNTDGSRDPSFNIGTGTNGILESVLIQSDGKIILVGGFTDFNGAICNGIARLNSDGSLDATFNVGSGASYISDAALQPDGKIIISGSFTSFNGVQRARIARLNGDGSLDLDFNSGSGPNNSVQGLALQQDGKVLIGGIFTTVDGISRSYIARLTVSGTLDASFDPGQGASFAVQTFAIQTNGNIIAGGSFTSYNGTGRNRIARINASSTTTPSVQASVMLQGPYNGTTMNDGLRTLPSFPLTEPFTSLGYSNAAYTPGATIGSSVLATTGNNAVVDWVIMEMRPAATPSTVAASRAVLLQRDGDVVDLDGVNSVGFAGLAAGSYCVAIRTRNHLPVMLYAATPIAYGSGIATVDFTLPTTQVYDDDSRVNVGGIMVLAAGDVNFNGIVQYTGTGNDRDLILTLIGGTTPTNTVNGYYSEDVNMDGVVIYTGSNNDRDIILQNIGGVVPTNTLEAGLP